MSDDDQGCKYELDPSRPRTWNGDQDDECYVNEKFLGEDNVWRCPHRPEPGKDTCIFHTALSEKDEEEVVERLVNILTKAASSPEYERIQEFFGAKFGEVNLYKKLNSDPRKKAVENVKCIFSHSQFAGGLNLSDFDFDSNVVFAGATVFGGAKYDGIHIGGVADFRGLEVTEELTFREAELRGIARFDDVIIDGEATFVGTEFSGLAKFTGAKFVSSVSFYRCIFEVGKFSENPSFQDANLKNADFQSVDLTSSTFRAANLAGANLESALLNRASLSDANLRGARMFGTMLGDAAINNRTRFLNKSEKGSITQKLLNKKYCVYDPRSSSERLPNETDRRIDQAKSVYRSIEEIAGRSARPRLQAECFIRRQDLQRIEYWRGMFNAGLWRHKPINFIRWGKAMLSKLIMLYGESPWRVVSTSLFVIIGFAMLYLVDWTEPDSGGGHIMGQVSDPIEFGNALYHSVLIFTGLGGSGYDPSGFGRVFISFEAILGPILTALLIFVLSRRAVR